VAFTIRSGGPDDVEDVVALWHRVADVLPSSTDDEPAVRALLDRDPEALLVGEADGRVVATVIVGWDGWRGNLYRLAVDPAFRRARVASSLIAEAERRLAATGCRRIAAAVQMDEDHAVQFWTAAGYVESGHAGRFVKNVT
jgi:ribosomal protein S18 acetylase RimI-like enzyme